MYYQPSTETTYTNSQMERRGLFNPKVNLPAAGFYPLSTAKPEYDPEIEQLTDERVEGSIEDGFRLVWDIESLPQVTVDYVLKERRIAEIKTLLEANDLASVRPLRAKLADTATEYDTIKLLELESEASALRQELASLTNQ